MSDFTIGLDLGQAGDYTALVIVEALETRGEEELALAIRHLQRFPLATSYPHICEYVGGLLEREPLARHTDLVVDATGCGRPVVDLLRRYGLGPVPVTITGGTAATRDDQGGWTVPKVDLVQTLAVLLQQGRLKCASVPGAEVLQAELLNFRVKVNPSTGHESFAAGSAGAWREGEHDDLVLATALACWYVEIGGAVSRKWARIAARGERRW